VIFERYEMFATTLSEHFRFGHTFNGDVLDHYGYKKFVFVVYVNKCLLLPALITELIFEHVILKEHLCTT